MTIFKNFFKSYFDQDIIAFHSGAIGGLSRKGEDIARFRGTRTEKPPSNNKRAQSADYTNEIGEARPAHV